MTDPTFIELVFSPVDSQWRVRFCDDHIAVDDIDELRRQHALVGEQIDVLADIAHRIRTEAS